MRHAALRKFPLPPARVMQLSGAAPIRLCPPPKMGEGEGGGHLSPVVSAVAHRVHRAFPRAKLAR